MKIGPQLKKARETKRFSQQEIADLLSISQKTLSNIESDKSTPSIEQLATLGKLYGLDILKLLSDHGITFNQQDQNGEENGIINGRHDPVEIREFREKLLREKDSRIALLEEYIRKLKEEISNLR
ncbi:helix-turn-helix domain-containing protein [Negadavirga shengliensis]|uniref:Helix-turn-helix domain-containing protein n=1 Tax=Negadavirga shengliensis TaxID=1389218 RepID=A0ABV9T732_9BACT